MGKTYCIFCSLHSSCHPCSHHHHHHTGTLPNAVSGLPGSFIAVRSAVLPGGLPHALLPEGALATSPGPGSVTCPAPPAC